MTETEAFLNRAQGALVGLAIGDALGTTLEFIPKHAVKPISDICGGGPFNLKAGQWTDDTSMALCLADSLLACGEHDPRDQIERYIRWRDHGYNSCTGHCFDIGLTVSSALTRYLHTSDANAGLTDERSAGNGSIMRLAPIVIFYAQNKGHCLERLLDYAAQTSLTTHGEKRSIEACRILASLLSKCLLGHSSKSEVMQHLISEFTVENNLSEPIRELRTAIQIANFEDTSRDQIFGRGYVVDSLQAAIWCFVQTDSFQDGALLAANLGDDADTTCAIYGQIAGAYYGIEGIPQPWLDKLYWRKRILDTATQLAACDHRTDCH